MTNQIKLTGKNSTNIRIVKSNGKDVRTTDNVLNTWVRDLDTGKLVPVDHK